MNVDARLVAPAVAAWSAAGILIGAPAAAVPAIIAAWAACGVATALAVWRRSGTLAVLAISAAAAGAVIAMLALHAPARQPAALLDAAQGGRVVALTATTTQTVRPGSGHIGVVLRSWDGVALAAPALLFGEHPPEVVGIGATIAFEATLTRAEPGDDVGVLAFTTRPPEVVAAPPWHLDWANALRERFLDATRTLPGTGGDLLAGLAIGDTSDVGDELDAAMKTTALSHLTAVSGANCAIVVGIVMLAGRGAGLPRWLRVAAAIAALAGFVVLVTPEPSVQRAAVMALVVLVAVWGGRPVRGIPVLCLATIALLVLDPWLARSYGFALSVLATAGLLVLAGPLARVLGRWMPAWLAAVIAVPVAAQLACQPVIVLLDAALPTYGVVANLLAAPAAPIATVVGLAACVLLPLVPPLGTLAVSLAWLPSAWIAAVADTLAAAPLARLPWPGGLAGLALLVLTSGLIVGAALLRGRGRVITASLLGLTVACYLGLAGGTRLADTAGRPADWQVAACDIGQGDAMVVRSGGRVALIDTGPDPRLLGACLGELGIGRVDLLVLTHFDHDHAGGTSAVHGRVDLALVGPTDGAADDRILDDLAAGGARIETVARGPSGVLGDHRWSVLGPPARRGLEPGNDASVVVHFQPLTEGGLSSIFLGDLGEVAQAALQPAVPPGDLDIVKVSHHGSADQSPALYARLAATVGLIGVGEGNGYGHPTERALDLLAAAGTTAFRTDLHGMILVAPGDRPGDVRVWTSR